jgi:hypothetical protein
MHEIGLEMQAECSLIQEYERLIAQ